MFGIAFALLVTTLSTYMRLSTCYVHNIFFSGDLLLLWWPDILMIQDTVIPVQIPLIWYCIPKCPFYAVLWALGLQKLATKRSLRNSPFFISVGGSPSRKPVIPWAASARHISQPAAPESWPGTWADSRVYESWFLILWGHLSSPALLQGVCLQSTRQCCDTLPSFQNLPIHCRHWL